MATNSTKPRGLRAQRLGCVKSEIETMQRLQSMLDDGFMALELLDEVGVAHSPALCLSELVTLGR